MKKLHLSGILCVLLAICVILGACGGGNASQSSEAGGTPQQSGEATPAEASGDGGVLGGQTLELKLRSGATSGSWYPATAAMAQFLPQDIPGLNVTVIPGAGPSNVQAVQDGLADFGLGKIPSTMQGLRGEEPFEAPTDKIGYMLYLYDEAFHIAVRADSGIETVEDLRGKALTTQTVGNLAEQMTREILEVHGMTYNDLGRIYQVGYDDSVQQVKDGQADAFTFATAIPASVLVELCSARDMKLISIPKDKLEELYAINDAYFDKVIPAGTYSGQDEDVLSFGAAIHMMASTDLSDELVYAITKSIVDNREKLGESHAVYQGLTPEIMAMETGVPFHPGALKYWQDEGLID